MKSSLDFLAVVDINPPVGLVWTLVLQVALDPYHASSDDASETFLFYFGQPYAVLFL